MDSTNTPTNTTDNFYKNLLKEHMGLLKMKIKMPVRDNKALALVYTPGVAASCLEIKNDKMKALKYTNKMNAMLVVSDSSALPDFHNNMAIIPYLEAICVYYKNLYNIDAYPLVLDHSKVKNSEDLYETIRAIMPAFSAVEFFNVSEERFNGFCEIYTQKNSDLPMTENFAFILSNNKRKLDDETLKFEGFNISANSIYGAILRAVLDTQTQGNLQKVLDEVLNYITDKKPQCLFQILSKTCNFIFSNDLSSLKKLTNNDKNEYNLHNEELSTQHIIKKYQKYIYTGNWVEHFPSGYHFHKKTNDENSLLLHARYRGVVGAGSKLEVKERRELDYIFSWKNLDSVSLHLQSHPEDASKLTCKRNLGAIITNGTAILGLGSIGALAGLPVMEGKSVLFKLYGGTDIVPFCVDELKVENLIRIIERITPIFSIINLEDIKSPDCFELEPRLNELVDFPVFHDDQHGTAVVVLAGIINALKLKKMNISDAKIVMNGAGAAGLSVTELLITYGAKNFVICDTEGAIYTGREKNMNEFKNKLASMTNKNLEKGKLSDIIKNSDIFIGLSAPKAVTQDMIKSMNKDPVIFALANPTPEIYPEEALEAGAFIVATGRSDFPNQINNSLAFPGIFRAAVDVRAKNITIEMKIAASEAIAKLVHGEELRPDFIMPASLDPMVSMSVCRAVAEVAFKQGQNQDKTFDADLIYENIHSWFLEEKLINFEFIREQNYQWKI
jgi:malic enzyme